MEISLEILYLDIQKALKVLSYLSFRGDFF